MDAIEPVNGVNLFVRRFGDPASPTLVVIHGGPPWDHSYLLPVAELADIAHVVLFDLRGSGRSDHDVPLRLDLIADDVAALIRRLGATRADVLGFSYGGGVAMRLVEQDPSGRLRLIPEAAHMAQFDNPAAWLAAVREFLKG